MYEKNICDIAHTLLKVSLELKNENITESDLTRLYHQVWFMHSTSMYIMYRSDGGEYESAGGLYNTTNYLLIKIIGMIKLKRGEEHEKDNIYSKN